MYVVDATPKKIVRAQSSALSCHWQPVDTRVVPQLHDSRNRHPCQPSSSRTCHSSKTRQNILHK
ncbi:hypothetical protein C8R48DRAFT_702536 [Suillus tomentosus]|nr:hypothetical protein C8R48DRAFT_702536 [Suillus tomentosus]